MQRRLLIALLMLFALRLTSCTSTEDDCNEVCEEAATCATPAVGSYGTGNCSGACASIENLVDNSDCGNDYADFLDCSLDAGDRCNLEFDCTSELLGYYLCIRDYCLANPTSRECEGVLCSSTATGTAPNCSFTRECTGGPRYQLACSDTECSCSVDGTSSATITYDPAYCSTDNDAALVAAAEACGWPP
jgi:hypothetical protein